MALKKIELMRSSSLKFVISSDLRLHMLHDLISLLERRLKVIEHRSIKKEMLLK
jgi:hypothetical protein